MNERKKGIRSNEQKQRSIMDLQSKRRKLPQPALPASKLLVKIGGFCGEGELGDLKARVTPTERIALNFPSPE